MDRQYELEPVAGLINAHLGSVRVAVFDDWRKNDDHERFRELITAFGSLEYVPGRAEEIYHILTETNLEGVPEVERLVSPLADMLTQITLLESGGLDEINRAIAYDFGQLQKLSPVTLKGGTRETRLAESAGNQALCDNLNSRLCSAIYLFPHLAQGVLVKVTGDWEEGRNRDALDTTHRRNYTSLVNGMKSSGRGTSVLCLPLPYYFTTGAHGTGERAAMGASNETVISQMSYSDEDHGHVPGIDLMLEKPVIVTRHTVFGVDEVQSISLAPCEEYTPFVRTFTRTDELEERANPLTQYLIFRDFERYPVEGITVVAPQYMTNLFPYKKGRTVPLCFLVKQEPGMTLYEMSEFQVWSDSPEKIVGELYYKAVKLVEGSPGSTVKKYTGSDIFRRLMQIPVQERRF